MALQCSKMFKCCFIVLLVIFLHQTECKPKGGRGRSGGSGSRYTGNRNTQHYDTSHSTGNNYNTGHHDTYHPSNTYQTGNSNPVAPSAPVPPSTNNRNIGFDHVNQQAGSHNNNPQGIGFENVQQRVPLQSNQPAQPPIGFNVPPANNQPMHPMGSPNVGHQPQSAYPVGTQNGQFSGNSGTYNHGNGQFGVNNAQNPHYNQQNPHYNSHPPQPSGPYYNPNLAQPGSYYNPHYGVQNGVPPVIYQPVQQSSGSNLLGYAGSFGGGYLLGRLTSGGGQSSGGQSSNDQQSTYTVHHYHHNSETVPKKISVSNSTLVTCSQNDTKGLCVPNTFPICLLNGTIMCVTHMPYTVPCSGLNTSAACVITVVPCVNSSVSGDLKCNTTTNLTTNAVYVPCISNVTLPSNLSMIAPSTNTTSNQTLISNQMELCVTVIAEPKNVVPPVVPPVGNPPQILATVGESPSNGTKSKNLGSRPGLTSGWAYILIFVLWVGT